MSNIFDTSGPSSDLFWLLSGNTHPQLAVCRNSYQTSGLVRFLLKLLVRTHHEINVFNSDESLTVCVWSHLKTVALERHQRWASTKIKYIIVWFWDLMQIS